ncbi:hypothetical protein DMN91_011171 [Ooceraea biroi]|uniref:Cilia- and flagella-associated protein 69 ARM repeats domain-containing protein n=1 Tax=Ooceraea biroi TaxID=2015173 RepID=A0A3L8DAD3_OOCBI|nr:hypothetical protein DMN91_011171 [Ooceraea biroi]
MGTTNSPSARESSCPDYIICGCPVGHLDNATKCHVTDVDYTIEKLRGLVSDSVTGDQVTRISRLLCDYLREIGDEGYVSFDPSALGIVSDKNSDAIQPIKHLPAVMQVLDFLARRSRGIDDYRAHLDRMLQLCSRPPLLKRTSESLISSVVMEQYFTLLGHLLMILPNEEQRQQICDAVDCLLIGRARLTNVAAVKMDFRRCAVENSRLPIIVVELLETALPKTYPMVLRLAFVLASVSYQCCYRMLEAGILNTLLTRMDLPYATQMHCIKPLDILLEGEEYPWDIMLLITNLLWNLMKSILPPRTLPENLSNLPSPKQCAMWGLRYSFKRHILHGQYCAANLRIRNDIAALILVGIMALPSWNLASSGIAEDIVDLLSAIESGSTKIWMEDVKFSDSEEDFFFKRILLMIIAHLADIDIYVFQKYKLFKTLGTICRQKAFETSSVTDSGGIRETQRHTHVNKFVEHKDQLDFNAKRSKDLNTRRLCAIVDQVVKTKFDECLAMIFARTICSMTLQDLSDNVLALEKLTMRRQRILTLLLTALESLLKKQTYVQQMYGERGVKIVTGIFVKCLYQKNEDSQVDQRLLLATGCYVWECIARCPNNLQIFLKAGGLYSMLDIIETTGYPVRCLYLGALTDMCDCTFCGPFLCTWRGADKKTGLMSLLASVWRQEEDRLGIKRRANGCIADPELPQMSTHQWTDTYRSKFTADVSPTIVDMLGSLQSKIFSILKIIERDEDKYEAVAEHYKILLNNLPTEDRITLCCVDMYLRLKLGQMWTELSRYLMQAGIAPLIVDAQLIAHMVQWHRSWGIFIEERQKKLVADAKRAEAFLEMEEFVRIRDSKLAPTLEALGEVEHIRRTTDRSYMLHKKDCQRRQVNAALSFPQDADVERCHRTFSDKTNVTVVFGQHQSIDSSHLKDLTCDLMELLPVSPPDSSSEKTFPVLDASGASGDTLLREDLFTDEYLIECLNR